MYNWYMKRNRTALRLKLAITTVMVSVLAVFLFGLHVKSNSTHAAAIIVVNSTADTASNDGVCTLREAIIAANNDTASGAAAGECIAGSGSDVINFAIAGGGVHTITPTSGLPNITSVVSFNGYSQSGSSANTAVSPLPFNGVLTIELNGTSAGTTAGLFFGANSSGSSVRGLVINRFTSEGIVLADDFITIAGNYIGTNTTGLTDLGNGGAGVTSNNTGGTDIQLGGLNPADRNIISGNEDSAAYPISRWIIQGNYVGLNALGTGALPNSTTQASGAFSIDDCTDVIVGGTQLGATNVISGNASHGLAPDNSPGLRVEGNLIGTNYLGTAALPNDVGITISRDQAGTVIGGTAAGARNIISGNNLAGVLGGSTTPVRYEGNYIGLNKAGTAAIPNGSGMLLGDNSVVGGSVAGRNVISGNTIFNVSIQGLSGPISGAEISGNYIGTNANGDIDAAITGVQGEGVRLSALTSENLIGGAIGNRIAGNRGHGVGVRSITVTSIPVTATPTKTAILGNEIYGNIAGGPIASAQGDGIDIYRATIASLSFPADFMADSYTELGPTPNDIADVDTGPNEFMNHPVIQSAVQDGTNLTVAFDLDAADSPNNTYRVEFFANDAADPTGYGEGQTYLGFTTVGNGVGQQAVIGLGGGTDLSGKSISATTTAIDAPTVFGYGATSEFSAARSISVITAMSVATGTLADTGDNQQAIQALALVAIFTAMTYPMYLLVMAYQRR